MSIFATFLRFLFDETEVHTRGEWAELLGVGQDRIEKWLADQGHPPEPQALREILRVLSESQKAVDVQRALTHIETVPRQRISPLHDSKWARARTLAEYLCMPFVYEFHRATLGLTIEHLESVLTSAATVAHKLKAEQYR
ncbi:MAG: hypothetical protein Q7T01_00190 [bacterium]|nr:hypothetical protein [bacterium]